MQLLIDPPFEIPTVIGKTTDRLRKLRRVQTHAIARVHGWNENTPSLAVDATVTAHGDNARITLRERRNDGVPCIQDYVANIGFHFTVRLSTEVTC